MFWLTPVGSILALVFAWYLSMTTRRFDEGTDIMKEIAGAVKEGARAYIKKQYLVVTIFFGIVFIILLVISLSNMLLIYVPFAFITGGFFSGLAGFIGLSQATNASARTANAARTSLKSGLKVAFAAGGVMGFVVVALGLLYLSIWFLLLNWVYRNLAEAQKIQNITSTMICFGMGASFQALFARVGGGIFTKAADVGADLVGKVEVGIPEDDPRNPAVIADNVGDNVGDVAGMGADLYESYVGSIIATMALAVGAGLGMQGVILPLVIATVGVLCSIIGTFLVTTKEEGTQATLLAGLRRGVWGSSILIAIISAMVIKFILPHHFGFYWAILSGLGVGLFIGFNTEFFTSDNYRPTRGISNSAKTGPAMVILEGLSVGMLSTAPSVIAVVIAVLSAYYLSGGAQDPNLGLFGVSIAAVGLLSTLGITLAADAYGPVADNAGGNAQMSALPAEIRQRTDALDALGNTTAATGKGFAIGSAALTGLALIAAYRDQLLLFGHELDLSITNPAVITGLFIGAMMPYAFCSLAIKAVGRAAAMIVLEVRRQFREIKGLFEGKVKPDYARAVSICTTAALKEMILPSLLSILTPLIVGIFLGPGAVVGLLAGTLISGFVLALKMANAGGAWDNAKKYIEKGYLGAKGSPEHKSAVVGDTVGDPFKDTAGPSLNILIKLMATSSITLAGFVLKMTLMK